MEEAWQHHIRPTERNFAILTGANPTVANWAGVRGTGVRKYALCYICDKRIVNSEFAGAYRRTKSSIQAQADHWEVFHEEDYNGWKANYREIVI